MLALKAGHLAAQVVARRLLEPIAGLAVGGRSAGGTDIHSRIVDGRLLTDIVRVPRIAGPELFQALQSDSLFRGAIVVLQLGKTAAEVDYRAGIHRIHEFARDIAGIHQPAVVVGHSR